MKPPKVDIPLNRALNALKADISQAIVKSISFPYGSRALVMVHTRLLEAEMWCSRLHYETEEEEKS